MARPRSDKSRGVMVSFRATHAEVNRWRVAAGEGGSLSDFLRASADVGAAFKAFDPAGLEVGPWTSSPAPGAEDEADRTARLLRGEIAALQEIQPLAPPEDCK